MKMTSRKVLTVLFSMNAALFAPNTCADETKAETESIWTRDKLTGGWGVLRTKLTDLGAASVLLRK